MHVSVDYYPAFDDVSKNMAALGAMGLEVHITEMDVSCANCSDERLAKQASIYGGMLSACLANSNCKSFETWGFTDAYTWLGTDKAPLPFNTTYGPKPAFWEMLAVLTK